MKKDRIKIIFCVLILTAVSVLGGCVLRPGPAKTEDGRVLFRLGFSGTPDSLNPYAAGNREAEAVLGLLYDSLFTVDLATGECVESLCQEYTVSDTVMGGKLWNITLQSGVLWHDGEPLTASDVEFSLQSAKDLSTLYSYPACEYLDTTGIAVEDDTHIAMVVWGEESYVKECLARIPILPRHIWNEQEGMDYDTSGVPADIVRAQTAIYSVGANTRTMIGSGPYIWAGYNNGVCSLTRNDEYWNGAAGPEAVELHYALPDPAAALTAGEIDACWDMSLNAYQTLAAEKAQHVTAGTTGELYILTFRFAGGSSPVRDIQVRQAVDCCLSRETILLQAFGGGYAERGLLPPFSPWHYANELTYVRPFSTATAAAVLENAGYRDTDGDGVREAPDGTPLRLTLLYSSGVPAWEKAAALLQGTCAGAGIGIRPVALPPEEIYDAVAEGEYDIYLSARQTWPEPFFSLGYFYWDEGFNAYAADDGQGGFTSRGWNDSGYANGEYDALYESLLSAADKETRRDLTRWAGELLYNEAAALPVGFGVEYQAYSCVWAGAAYCPGSGVYFAPQTLAAQLRGMTAAGKQ